MIFPWLGSLWFMLSLAETFLQRCLVFLKPSVAFQETSSFWQYPVRGWSSRQA